MKRLLVLLLLLPVFLFGSIGKITVLTGDVKIKRDSGVIKAKSGTKLEKKDFISTDKNGKVQIVFNDKTIFTIGKNSTLDIADYLYDESKPKKNKAKFNVLKGAFSSITGKIGKLNKSKFKLKTKSASIGIRGTIVKANQDVVMCTEGAITVETLNGAAVRVEAGQKTTVTSGTPTAPEPIVEGDVESLDVDIIDETAAGGSALNEADTKENAKTVAAEEAETAQAAVEEDTDDIQSEATNTGLEDAVKPRNVTLTGRAISTDGSQQKVTIDATNVKGDFSLGDNTELEMVDDSGEKVDSVEDSTVTWGHWADDPSKKWVAGEATDVKVLDEMRDNTEQTVNAEYTGKVMGSVDGTDDIKMDNTNQVQMNFELGAGKNNMDGSIDFETKSGQEWNSEFSGTTSGSTFNSTTMSGSATTDGVEQGLTSGGVDGQFYGEKAEAVGGTFQMNTNENTATGVFKATK